MSFYVGRPVIGFRKWKIDVARGALRSCILNSLWVADEETEGHCVQGAWRRAQPDCKFPHPAPHVDCSCGLYGYNRQKDLRIKSELVVPDDRAVYGIFAAWGRIIFHDKGFRAQYGRPIAVVEKITGKDDVNQKLFRSIVQKYELNVVPKGKLTDVAKKYGDLVDHEAYV